MSTQVEQIVHSSVGAQKPLCLMQGLESPHAPLSRPSRLMGKSLTGICALSYASVAAVGVVVLELGVDGPLLVSIPNWLPLIPYLTVVISAGFLGAKLSGWYLSETGVFELVAVPVLVLPGASLVAGLMFSIAGHFVSHNQDWVLKDIAGGTLLAAFFYIRASWTLLVPVAAVVSFLIWRRYRNASAAGVSTEG